MMKAKRILTICLAAILIFSLAACSNQASTDGNNNGNADADVKTITFAHATAEGTSTNDGALKFKEYVEANSNGKLKVNVYPNAQLGGDRELIENTQNGSITAMLSSPAPQVSFVQAATVFDLPFVFESMEHGRKVFNDPDFMAAISKQYAEAGFHYLGASAQGFRTLTSNRKVTSLEDLKGLTIRTMENKFHLKTWELLGANPTPLAFNELYTALQQGTVDAQENPIELVHSQKFYEQQKYIMDTNHIIQSNAWIMNKAFYDSLSDDLKAVVDEAGRLAVETANRVSDEKEPGYIETISNFGCEFVDVSDEEVARFQEAVKPVYEEIRAAADAETYDAYMNAVEKYKSN